MTTIQLRNDIKKAVDTLPPKRLASLADCVAFPRQAPLTSRINAAEKAIAVGRGTNWRKVRADV